MKKSVLFAAVALAALLVSCKKDDSAKPSISWASNEKFAQVELAPGIDGAIVINAPAGIQTLTLTLNLGAYNILPNQYIGTSSNKGSASKSPVLDVIDDATAATFINGLSMSAGSSLRGKTVAAYELIDILQAIAKGQVIENNTSFSVDIAVSDKGGNVVAKTAKFHFTAAPEYSWSGNSNFDIVDLAANVPAVIKVKAPGKITELTVTLDSGAPELETYIRNRTTGKSKVIDLINDENASQYFGFPSIKNVSGKTDVSLDFGFMKQQAPDFSTGVNVFTVYTKDANGKEASVQLKFEKK